MAPPPRRSIAGATACMPSTGPIEVDVEDPAHVVGLLLAAGGGSSGWPRCSPARRRRRSGRWPASTTRPRPPASVTSWARATAASPRERGHLVDLARPGRRCSTTRAPSATKRRASASPWPRAAPVMIATLPSSRPDACVPWAPRSMARPLWPLATLARGAACTVATGATSTRRSRRAPWPALGAGGRQAPAAPRRGGGGPVPRRPMEDDMGFRPTADTAAARPRPDAPRWSCSPGPCGARATTTTSPGTSPTTSATAPCCATRGCSPGRSSGPRT